MMSVPAINSLPPSGNQTSKMNSSPTANASVTPIGLSVSPKLSVIPAPQLPATQTKSPTGVNHSAVPLSLVYENKIAGTQGQPAVTKPQLDKPKDLSPAKPTSNGVEVSAVTKSPPSQPVLPSTTISTSSKPEEIQTQQQQQQPTQPQNQATTTNHSEKKVPPNEGTNEPAVSKEETAQSPVSTHQTNTATVSKVEQNSSQAASAIQEEQKESKTNNEATQSTPTKDKLGTDIKTPEAPVSTTPQPSATTNATASTTTTKSPTSIQPNKRKRDQKTTEKKDEEPEPEPEKKPRRIRSQVLPYQSPLPELATFISKTLKEKDATQKNNEEKLIVFYKNEFLAVRNAESGFYLCQTLQNVYRSSHRIRIRWLSQDKDKSNDEGDIYTPDFYDVTDFECILTTVALSKTHKNMYKLQKVELERIENILKRALDVEKGVTEKPSITEEHPDGIDLSLYKDESQLQKPKKASKRAASSPSRKSPKHVKKEESTEAEKTPRKAPAKTKRRKIKPTKKVVKISVDKAKAKKRGGGKSDSKSSKTVDQLKVSPPNEKARVVAKVLRKVDIVPAKEVQTKKPSKSKAAKRSQERAKNQKKKSMRGGGVKKGNAKDGTKAESSSSQSEKRQAKGKPLNAKSKKN